jgi:hypothetical protein
MSAQMTKREAVRRALAAGMDKPKAGVEYIREKFGIAIDPHTFSLSKVAVRKQEAKKQQAKERGGEGVTGGLTGGADDAAALAKGVKQLVDRFGAEAVGKMLGVFVDRGRSVTH